MTFYTTKGTLERHGSTNPALIESYLPMVRRAAHRLLVGLPANIELDDLVQAGMLGLMDAMQRYEAGHGAQFETFAMQRVRGAMLDELRGADWVPRSVRRHQREIAAAVQRLEHRLQRAPTDAEIAADLQLTLQAYHDMLVDVRGAQLVYADDDEGEDGQPGFFDRQGLVEHKTDPASQLADRRFREALVRAIEHLPEREQQVMGMYYEHDMNLREIAAVLGVTESRVCQLHSQSVARLRARLSGW